MPTITTTQTTKVKLAPALATKILKKLRIAEQLRDQANIAKAAQKKIEAEVEQMFADAGEWTALCEGVKIDDIPLKMVSGLTSYLDKKEFVALGGDLALLEHATKTKPKKAYLKISWPGERSEEADD